MKTRKYKNQDSPKRLRNIFVDGISSSKTLLHSILPKCRAARQIAKDLTLVCHQRVNWLSNQALVLLILYILFTWFLILDIRVNSLVPLFSLLFEALRSIEPSASRLNEDWEFIIKGWACLSCHHCHHFEHY